MSDLRERIAKSIADTVAAICDASGAQLPKLDYGKLADDAILDVGLHVEYADFRRSTIHRYVTEWTAK